MRHNIIAYSSFKNDFSRNLLHKILLQPEYWAAQYSGLSSIKSGVIVVATVNYAILSAFNRNDASINYFIADRLDAL